MGNLLDYSEFLRKNTKFFEHMLLSNLRGYKTRGCGAVGMRSRHSPQEMQDLKKPLWSECSRLRNKRSRDACPFHCRGKFDSQPRSQESLAALVGFLRPSHVP